MSDIPEELMSTYGSQSPTLTQDQIHTARRVVAGHVAGTCQSPWQVPATRLLLEALGLT